MQAQGVIVREPGGAPLLEDITVDNPGPGEVVVRIQASGVCHTDHMYLEGSVGDDSPTCSAMRAPVWWRRSARAWKTPSVGDFVILAWRAPCGLCRFCASVSPISVQPASMLNRECERPTATS